MQQAKQQTVVLKHINGDSDEIKTTCMKLPELKWGYLRKITPLSRMMFSACLDVHLKISAERLRTSWVMSYVQT